jgi:hypothetical protein
VPQVGSPKSRRDSWRGTLVLQHAPVLQHDLVPHVQLVPLHALVLQLVSQIWGYCQGGFVLPALGCQVRRLLQSTVGWQLPEFAGANGARRRGNKGAALFSTLSMNVPRWAFCCSENGCTADGSSGLGFLLACDGLARQLTCTMWLDCLKCNPPLLQRSRGSALGVGYVDAARSTWRRNCLQHLPLPRVLGQPAREARLLY